MRGYKSLANIYKEILNDEEKYKIYNERANKITSGIEENLWDTNKVSNDAFKLYDYAYKNSSYNRLLFDKIYYPDVLAQIYPVLWGIIDANSDRGKQLYFLHSYYSDGWYNYDKGESSYPHMQALKAVLMYDEDEFEVNSYSINVKYQTDMAISKILYWETKKIGEYTWNCQEAGSTISAINMYLNKRGDFPII